jgi:PLP dependent protein
MTEISENILSVKSKLPEGVRLVAVSKTRTVSEIMEAYGAGQRIFGENRAAEMLSKWSGLPRDIQWHMIGHLQTNKVKSISPFVSMIHSVDSFRLLSAIDSEAGKSGRIIDCLLQFHIASEETKFGFNISEAGEMLDSAAFKDLRSVRICGVMGMATFTENEDVVRAEFRTLLSYFKELKEKYFTSSPSFREVSMGMSGDYLIAVEEGSTMVRIGSLIFGERKK